MTSVKMKGLGGELGGELGEQEEKGEKLLTCRDRYVGCATKIKMQIDAIIHIIRLYGADLPYTTPTQTHTHTHMHMHTQSNTHTRRHTLMHAHMCARTCIQPRCIHNTQTHNGTHSVHTVCTGLIPVVSTMISGDSW